MAGDGEEDDRREGLMGHRERGSVYTLIIATHRLQRLILIQRYRSHTGYSGYNDYNATIDVYM